MPSLAWWSQWCTRWCTILCLLHKVHECPLLLCDRFSHPLRPHHRLLCLGLWNFNLIVAAFCTDSVHTGHVVWIANNCRQQLRNTGCFQKTFLLQFFRQEFHIFMVHAGTCVPVGCFWPSHIERTISDKLSVREHALPLHFRIIWDMEFC